MKPPSTIVLITITPVVLVISPLSYLWGTTLYFHLREGIGTCYGLSFFWAHAEAVQSFLHDDKSTNEDDLTHIKYSMKPTIAYYWKTRITTGYASLGFSAVGGIDVIRWICSLIIQEFTMEAMAHSKYDGLPTIWLFNIAMENHHFS